MGRAAIAAYFAEIERLVPKDIKFCVEVRGGRLTDCYTRESKSCGCVNGACGVGLSVWAMADGMHSGHPTPTPTPCTSSQDITEGDPRRCGVRWCV